MKMPLLTHPPTHSSPLRVHPFTQPLSGFTHSPILTQCSWCAQLSTVSSDCEKAQSKWQYTISHYKLLSFLTFFLSHQQQQKHVTFMNCISKHSRHFTIVVGPYEYVPPTRMIYGSHYASIFFSCLVLSYFTLLSKVKIYLFVCFPTPPTVF